MIDACAEAILSSFQIDITNYQTTDEIIQAVWDQKKEGENLVALFQRILLQHDWQARTYLRHLCMSIEQYLTKQAAQNHESDAFKTTVQKCQNCFIEQRRPLIYQVPQDVRCSIISFIDDVDTVISLTNTTTSFLADCAKLFRAKPDLLQKVLKRAFEQGKLIETAAQLSKYLEFDSNVVKELASECMSTSQMWELLTFVDRFCIEKAFVARILLSDTTYSRVQQRTDTQTSFYRALLTQLNPHLGLKQNRTKDNACFPHVPPDPIKSLCIKKISLPHPKIGQHELIQILNHCPELEELDLRGYQNFTDPLADAIARLGKIKKLLFAYVSCTMKQLSTITNGCRFLEELDLSFSELTFEPDDNFRTSWGLIPYFTINLPHVRKLNLNNVKNLFISFKAPSVEEVSLINAVIHDIKKPENFIQFLGSMTKLKRVYLSQNQSLTNTVIEQSIKSCPSLNIVHLGDYLKDWEPNFSGKLYTPTAISDEALRSILHMKKLEGLSLSYLGASEELIQCILQKFVGLRELMLTEYEHDSRLSNSVVSSIKNLTELRRLCLSNCNENLVQEILHNKTHLESLEIHSPCKKAFGGLSPLKNVSKLTLSVANYTISDWDDVVNAFPVLRRLTLIGCSRDLLGYVCKTFPNLEELTLHTDIPTPEILEVRSLSKLKTLNLRQVDTFQIPLQMTEEELSQIVIDCKNLENLSLFNCREISKTILKKLPILNTNLRKIFYQPGYMSYVPSYLFKQDFCKKFPHVALNDW